MGSLTLNLLLHGEIFRGGLAKKQLVIDSLFKDVHVAKPGNDARGIGNIDSANATTGSHLVNELCVVRHESFLLESLTNMFNMFKWVDRGDTSHGFSGNLDYVGLCYNRGSPKLWFSILKYDRMTWMRTGGTPMTKRKPP